MCVILPVDHIPCTHTVAIWQHCINAPRSKAYGLGPCQRVRQHARPIVTRKLCINCGGPRFFARRGGLAERGSGSNGTIAEEEGSDEIDSGYQSDVIFEEDEDVDIELSPRSSRAIKGEQSSDKELEARLAERGFKTCYTSQSRRRSWRPNLKRDLSEESSSTTFYRPESTNSQFSYLSEGFTRSKRSYQPSRGIPRSIPSSLEPPRPSRRPHLPLLNTNAIPSSHHPSPPRRKDSSGSTLLHPSSPSTEPVSPITNTNTNSSTAFTFTFPMRQRLDVGSELNTERQDRQHSVHSTLLHPSSPPEETSSEPRSSIRSSGISSFILPECALQAPVRPSTPQRKNSTLLHPSSPPDDASTDDVSIKSTTDLRTFPYPLPTPPSSSHSGSSSDSGESGPASASSGFTFSYPPTRSLEHGREKEKKRPSVIHSSQSDYWDSEAEVEREEGGEEVVIMATTARMARASRIDLGGADAAAAHLRALQAA